MSVRMPALVLASVTISSLALALPTAAAVAEPHQPDAPTARPAVDRPLRDRVAETASLVPRPERTSTRLPKAALGTVQRESPAPPSTSRDSASGTLGTASSGVLSASTDTGTWHFPHSNGTWGPPEWFAGELNTSWSPAGDRYAWTSVANGRYTNHVSDPWTGETVDYPVSSAGHRDLAWTSFGDGFLAKIEPTDGTPSYVTQSTTPAITGGFHAGPEYGPAAIFPLGGEMYSRVALSATTSDIVRWPYSQTGNVTNPTPTPLGFEQYHPGDPAVAQGAPEALGGAWPGEPSVPTNMAFLGVDPADSTVGHLYVNHQEAFPAKTPVPVATFQAHPECDLPAPAFSPDRRTIYFVAVEGTVGAPCDTTDVRSVTVGSNGRFDAPDAYQDTAVVGPTGVPFRTLSVRDDALPLVEGYRVSGKNRYEVGIATSEAFFDDESADAVVVSGGTAYADALAGGPLAGAMGGPVLLTYPNALHAGVAAEVDRVLAPGGTVYITGGTASVSAAVQAALTKPGRTVRRLAGANRYEVAVNIAKEMDRLRGGVPNAAFVAGGTAFADALVAGPAAVHEDGPILLATDTGLNAVTLGYLDSVDNVSSFRVYGVGGSGSRAVAPRPNDVAVTGASRYDVALAVANRFFTGEYYAALADGRNWPDAVAGGAAMSGQDMPIMLVNGSTLPPQTASRIKQSAAAVDMVVAFGGPASIPDEPLWDAADLAGTQTPLWGPDTGQ